MVVRTDSYSEVQGEIIAADEDTGECSLRIAGESKSFNFGPGGIRLVSRRR